MKVDVAEIERVLSPLVGLPLFQAHDAADLKVFAFGQAHVVPRRFPQPGKPSTSTVGDYALHVQCAWRIVGPDGVEIASRTRPELPRAWFETTRTVQRIKADARGRITLELAGEVSLQVTPAGTEGGEVWRFFRPNGSDPHFVIPEEVD